MLYPVLFQEKFRQQKHNFTLQKEEEAKFRQEHERLKAEAEKKNQAHQEQQETLKSEMERRREIFKMDDNIKGLAKAVEIFETEEVWTNPNKIVESRVYRPQVSWLFLPSDINPKFAESFI